MKIEIGNSNGGIGFIGLLTIAFVVLKLTNLIDWSWFWVLSPLWICASVSLLVLLICFIVAVIMED